MTKETFDKIIEELAGIGLDCDIEYDEALSSDDIFNFMQDENVFNYAGEVTYYANAMQYLRENDVSLTESLEIAKEYGYNIDALNSEVLASLLKTRNLEEEAREILNRYE